VGTVRLLRQSPLGTKTARGITYFTFDQSGRNRDSEPSEDNLEKMREKTFNPANWLDTAPRNLRTTPKMVASALAATALAR